MTATLATTLQFTYLGSTIRSKGGEPTRTFDRELKKLEEPAENYDLCGEAVSQQRHKDQACVLSVLLYGYLCQRMTVHDLHKLQSSHLSFLRVVWHISWSRKISNNELFKLSEQGDMGIVLVRRRWRWIGHVFRRETTNISKVVHRWTPEGERKRGCPNPPGGGLQKQNFRP